MKKFGLKKEANEEKVHYHKKKIRKLYLLDLQILVALNC